jgi:hypothetical protein
MQFAYMVKGLLPFSFKMCGSEKQGWGRAKGITDSQLCLHPLNIFLQALYILDLVNLLFHCEVVKQSDL